MTEPETPPPPAVGSLLERGVGRLVPKRAGLADQIVQACALHALVLTLGAKPGSERSANDVSREAALMDAQIEGELWSFLRTVMAQGVDIALDAERLQWSYEQRSARLDAAAAERAEELLARLKTPNVV